MTKRKDPPPVKCYYNGKLHNMDYVPDPKDRFKFACYRIRDNATSAVYVGYVVEGEKVYRISNASKMAILLGDDAERAKVLEEITALEVTMHP